MKSYNKYILSLFFITLTFSACNLEENPSFPAADNLFTDEVAANTVLNGVYASLASFNYYGADYHHLLNMSSGLYNTNRDASLKDIAGLNPFPSLNFVENVWRIIYQTISRSNDIIENMEGADIGNEFEQNNILGQSYFIRSLSYFNLIRIYGKCPLITETVTSTSLNFPLASPEEVYAQIISDAQQAEALLPELGQETSGRPAKYAANMLLAKVYMQLAGDKTSGETDYWQKAFDEAIKIYGKYSLVNNFGSLWFPESSNNTSESIFEIHGNEEYTLRMLQLFTASNGYAGRNSWGRFKPNLEVYDRHVENFPEDPRIGFTFITEWTKFAPNGKTQNIVTYPTFKNRNNKDKSYPWTFKYFNKDIYANNYNTNQNLVVFRYADLLLMLAEIENELNGPANAAKYINEVRERARNSGAEPSSQPEDIVTMDQNEFRNEVMMEYMFELLCEGHDWFNVRRRGYPFFKEHVIDAHNNHPKYDFKKARDVEYPDNPRIMVMPIPGTEITANPNISSADQNAGY